MNGFTQTVLTPVQPISGKLDSAEIQDETISNFQVRLWQAIMVTNLIVLIVSRVIQAGTGSPYYSPDYTALAVTVDVVQHAVAIGNLLFARSRLGPPLRAIYIVFLHTVTPLVIIFLDGVRGYGDIAIFVTIMVSSLYGFRRWMIVSFSFTAAALVYSIYLDVIGQTLATVTKYPPQFAPFKIIITMIVTVLITVFGNLFYRTLLNRYRNNAAQLQQAVKELTVSNQTARQLSADLQLSRQRIVTAREEERRRLRRDLHDGLGPTLAAQVFRIGAIRTMLHAKPDQADAHLEDLELAIENTLTDVRRLVYALRPPSLDQLGLLGAIQDHVRKSDAPFEIELQLPSQLIELGAAAEVALFRIVQTSLDNVAQHAKASRCLLTLEQNTAGGVTLAVADNGVGISAETPQGVGLTAMRERAEELGGTFSVEPHAPTGTRLCVFIPAAISQTETLPVYVATPA